MCFNDFGESNWRLCCYRVLPSIDIFGVKMERDLELSDENEIRVYDSHIISDAICRVGIFDRRALNALLPVDMRDYLPSPLMLMSLLVCVIGFFIEDHQNSKQTQVTVSHMTLLHLIDKRGGAWGALSVIGAKVAPKGR